MKFANGVDVDLSQIANIGLFGSQSEFMKEKNSEKREW